VIRLHDATKQGVSFLFTEKMQTFLFSTVFRLALSSGYRGSFLGELKQTGRETDHSSSFPV
jgi:hypothetical protein